MTTVLCNCNNPDDKDAVYRTGVLRRRRRRRAAKFWIRGRKRWLAAAPKSVSHADWSSGVHVFVHHTADPGPRKSDVRKYLRSIQRFHMVTRGWSDIAYNYLIDPDGRVWEGRGFGVIGAHTEGRNSRSIGICFMGTFTDKPPTIAAVTAYWNLLRHLRTRGARILGDHAHGEVYPTQCPGRGTRKALDL